MCDKQLAHAPNSARRLPPSMAAAPILLGLLVFHFMAVGLHVCPPNPVSVAAQAWVRPYIHPYFSQRWELFAPEPAGTNYAVHIRCHRLDDNERIVTDWIDITAPLLDAHQRNRFGAASRMLRASRPRLTTNRKTERRAVASMDGPLARRATELLDAEGRRAFERGAAHAQRLASAECARRFDDVIEQVEVRIVSTKVPPYGLRHDPPPQSPTAIVLPAMPYVEVSR